ncbi:hypothetical protein QQF64_019365 [Cirrhinus molitorella]|uniref:Immunoglobulin V-set domain-containing protein n=1 Tax=Cirrhinus molitorella TaxID=172907 RepID=A0ABR3LF90_9TELE
MKTLLLSMLCLFVWNQSTEALTDQQVVLGQNATLSCEFKCNAAIWFLLKLPARPMMILRTFASNDKTETDYYDENFRNKYLEVTVSDCTPLKPDVKFGERDRGITSIQSNGTVVPPQIPLTDPEYLDVQPNFL